MNDLTLMKSILPAITPENVMEVESAMLQLPQVACDVIHRFGPGLYIREVFIPAGTFAIGHHQKYEHMNVFLKGRVLILKDDGTTEELVAPMSFVGKPGRKIGYALEDMYWQNIYATDERDIEALEGMFFEKDAVFESQSDIKLTKMSVMRQNDRDDYVKMLAEEGFTDAVALAQSHNSSDRIELPLADYCVMVGPSPIEGKGVFATAAIAEGQIIGPARLNGLRTDLGRFTNHSASPNALMVHDPRGDIYLIASRAIPGCAGGEPSEEITVDYRQAIAECREASRSMLCPPSQPPS